MKTLTAALAIAALFTASPAVVAQTADHSGHAGHAMPAAQMSAESTASTDAMVKKVDKAGGKVTLAHGPLRNLGMPPMTMVFKVKDTKVLGTLKEGDKIRFVAEQAGNDYLASKIEKVK